jgi:predicted transcriptional regulator
VKKETIMSGGLKMSRYRNRRRLGEAELEIMQIVWQSDKAMTSNDISKAMNSSRKWALSTLMTSLARLERKGFVDCDRSTRSNLYTAIITETNYRTTEGKSFIEKLYNNSVKDFVMNLYDNDSLSAEQIDELRMYLDSLEK